jgi:hypothetical protein
MVKAAVDSEDEVQRAASILRKIGTEADANLVLDWLGSEVSAGGTAVEPEPPAPTLPPDVPAPGSDVADLSRVSKDKITGTLRSAGVKGDSVHLDFSVPAWPREGSDINLTWMVAKVVDGVATKAGRFEHGRPSNSTREAAKIFNGSPGFQINRGDRIAIWACASILNHSRKQERTNAVWLES